MLFIVTASLFMMNFSSHERISGEKILKDMYSRYHGNWYKDFSFTQKSENYRNDSLTRTSIWHEAIVFPDYFRITIGDIRDGNAMLQVKDSAFHFRKGKLVRRGPKGEDLTFLLGGMYFMPFGSVKTGIAKEGYNISKAHESSFAGRKMYVIGTESDTAKANQLWIDEERLIVMRFIKYDDNRKEEGVFGDHKQFGKAWSETSCSFFINDKLFQKETYSECVANGGVNMKLFDPYDFYQQ